MSNMRPPQSPASKDRIAIGNPGPRIQQAEVPSRFQVQAPLVNGRRPTPPPPAPQGPPLLNRGGNQQGGGSRTQGGSTRAVGASTSRQVSGTRQGAPSGGLGQAPAFVGENLIKTGAKTPFTCIEPSCFRTTTPGPQGTAYYKKGGEGPFCAEHWRDEVVTHTRNMAGAAAPPCQFGARYTDEQAQIMKSVIQQVQAQAQQLRRPLTLSLLQDAFKTQPKLRNEAPCPNCQQIVVWWPDPRLFSDLKLVG